MSGQKFTFLNRVGEIIFFLTKVMASHSALYARRHKRVSRLQIFSTISAHSMLTSTRNFQKRLQKLIPLKVRQKSRYNCSKNVRSIQWPAIESQMHSDLKACKDFSVALDEFCDIQDKPQLAVFARSMSNDCESKEELLDIVPFKDRTCGIHVKDTMIAAFFKADYRKSTIAEVWEVCASLYLFVRVWCASLQ